MNEPDRTVEDENLHARITALERRAFQLQTLYDIGEELESRPDLLLDPTAAGCVRVILTAIMGAFGATRGLALLSGATGAEWDIARAPFSNDVGRGTDIARAPSADERGADIAVQKGFDEDGLKAYPVAWGSPALSADYRQWRASAPRTLRSWLASRLGADEGTNFVRWLRTVGIQVWVPFQVDEGVIGGVGLGDRLSGEGYSQDDVALLETIVDNAMVRLRHARLLAQSLAQQREQYRIRGLFEQFMPPQVVDRLLDGRLAGLVGERQTVTILMGDLRNSTALIEQLPSEAMVGLLNDYFAAMTDIIFRYEGTVDKFMGDSVLAVFGAPVSHRDHPELDDVMRAVRGSVEMQVAFAELLETWQLEIPPDLGFGLGIGICTGEVVVGNVGSAKRVEYTAIGPPVNLAARLCKLAPGGETYIDERTYLAASPVLKVRRLRPIKAKGFREPMHIFQVREIRSDRGST